MRRTDPEGRGPVRYGPPAPEPGLPVLPELAAPCSRPPPAHRRPSRPAAGRCCATPPAATGDGADCPAAPTDVAAAPGAPALLLALFAALRRRRPAAAALRRLVDAAGPAARAARLPCADPGGVRRRARSVRAAGDRAPGPGRGRRPAAARAVRRRRPDRHRRPARTAARGLRGGASGRAAHHQRRDLARHRCTTRTTPCCSAPPRCCPDEVTVLTDLAGALLPAALAGRRRPLPRRPRGARLPARRVLDVLTALGALRRRPGRRRRRARPRRTRPGQRQVGRRRTRCTRASPPRSHHAVARRRRPRPAPAGRPPPLRRPRPAARPRSPRAESATPGSWRTISPPGSGRPRPAATASATSSGPCGYACPPARCSAPTASSARSPRRAGSAGTAACRRGVDRTSRSAFDGLRRPRGAQPSRTRPHPPLDPTASASCPPLRSPAMTEQTEQLPRRQHPRHRATAEPGRTSRTTPHAPAGRAGRGDDRPPPRTTATAPALGRTPPRPAPLAEPRPLGEPRTLAAVLRRPADRPAARPKGHGPASPARAPSAPAAEGLADIPRLPFEPGPLPGVGRAHRRRHLGRARQLGDARSAG